MKNRGIRLREIGQDAIDWCIRAGKKDLRTFVELQEKGTVAKDDQIRLPVQIRSAT